MHSPSHSVVSPHAPEEVDNTFTDPMCNGNVGSANVYLTTAGLARSSCAVQGNPQTSHDDEANLPLPSQDDAATQPRPLAGRWLGRRW